MNGKSTCHNWYVLYTHPKAERKANKKLQQIGMATFLPLHKILRQWSDRKKKLEVPLFPNYIFVYTTSQERFEVFKVSEVIKFVSFEGKPVSVAESTIDSLRKMLREDIRVSNEEFQEGKVVKIKSGHLSGVEGILIRKRGVRRLIVKIEALNTCISADIDAKDVELA